MRGHRRQYPRTCTIFPLRTMRKCGLTQTSMVTSPCLGLAVWRWSPEHLRGRDGAKPNRKAAVKLISAVPIRERAGENSPPAITSPVQGCDANRVLPSVIFCRQQGYRSLRKRVIRGLDPPAGRSSSPARACHPSAGEGPRIHAEVR